MSGSIQDNKNLVEFSPGNAWNPYPPKKILFPSDDTVEVSTPKGVETAMDESGGGKNIKKKNKTRKDKRKN